MTAYLYRARLVPIGQPVRIPDPDTGRTSLHQFDDKSFEIERTSKAKPGVWVNHDRALNVGKVETLAVRQGWWIADLVLDPDVDEELQVGQPVSVGLISFTRGSGDPYLRESASSDAV